MAEAWRGLATAVRTLSVLPAPGRDAASLASALPWFPLVGALLGGMVWTVARGVGALWPEGAAVLAVAAAAALTRGLHLDGVADVADGFGGGRDREHALAIMKDPRAGSFGVVALTLVLLLKTVAFARLAATGQTLWIVAAGALSRAMQVELAATLPYAREDGTAGAFVRGARPWHRALAHLLALAVAWTVAGPAGLAAALLAWLVCRLIGATARRRIGGVTGDVLGACSEWTETAVVFAAALAGGWLLER